VKIPIRIIATENSMAIPQKLKTGTAKQLLGINIKEIKSLY
jgi:hypothetical protein